MQNTEKKGEKYPIPRTPKAYQDGSMAHHFDRPLQGALHLDGPDCILLLFFFPMQYSSWLLCIGIPDSSLFVEYCRILGNFVHCKSTCASDFLCLFPSSWKRFSILVVLQNSTITWPHVYTGVFNG